MIDLTQQITITLPLFSWIYLAMFEWTGFGIFLVGLASILSKLFSYLVEKKKTTLNNEEIR